jgi:hypothetical protein
MVSIPPLNFIILPLILMLIFISFVPTNKANYSIEELKFQTIANYSKIKDID